MTKIGFDVMKILHSVVVLNGRVFVTKSNDELFASVKTAMGESISSGQVRFRFGSKSLDEGMFAPRNRFIDRTAQLELNPESTEVSLSANLTAFRRRPNQNLCTMPKRFERVFVSRVLQS